MAFWKRSSIALAAAAIAACSDSTQPTSMTSPQAPTRSVQSDAAGGRITDQYIVVFNKGVANAPGLARALANAHGGQLGFTYQHAIKGFSVRLNSAAAAALAKNPNVELVEPDQIMTASGTQTGATWGLDRIDQRNLPLSTTYTYPNDGTGVTAYIIDTGILLTHSEFAGRAVTGYDAITLGGTAADCNGHGTHVSGTVGGSTYGVAKNVSLVAVRVLNCQGSGTNAQVIAGIDWVTADHQAGHPAVANMSLGGGASSALDAAVANSIADGVTYAIAAGNGDQLGRQLDACTQSPARVAAAITIGAADKTDKKASWSNYGNCVDFFAPGVGITSSWNTSNTATNTISGTSMATPHVTGSAALYLQANPGSTPQQVRDGLYAMTTKGIVTSSSTANNHLLYVGDIGGGGPPANVPPTANFTYSCTNLACSFTDGSTDAPPGTVASWSWSFGDGATATAQNPSHTYASGGTYSVTLTATDNDGAPSAPKTVTVSVSPAGGGGITLAGSGHKVKGNNTVDLTWSGATTTSVDIFRGAAKITTANDGAYSESLGKGSASYSYKVCNSGSTTQCSNTVTVNF